MPNYCDYEMRVKGTKEAIKEFLDCLNADYNYLEGNKPEHKHFFRVFQAETYEEEPEPNEDGTYTQTICGYCAWSVASCMLSSGSGYYRSVKKEHPEIFMGTSLEELSKELSLTIEVFSEEPGMCFSEHYIFKNGECVCEETSEIETAGYDDKGKITTDIDWETYEGETVILNPNRHNQTEEFYYSVF